LNISPYFLNQHTFFPLWEYNLINKTLTPLNIKFNTIYPLTLAYNIRFLDVDKYVIYGDFLSINDIPLFRIELYDKQQDLLIPVGSKGGKGINGRVNDIKLFVNKLYLTGDFDKVHNYSFKNLTMLDLNTFYYKGYLGYYDEGLKPIGSYLTLQQDINGKINSLKIDSNYIYIAGEFTKIKNSNIFGLAKYNLKSCQ